jgi:protein O-GlcNAc transferase
MKRRYLLMTVISLLLFACGTSGVKEKAITEKDIVEPKMTYKDSLLLAEQYVQMGVDQQVAGDYLGSIEEWEKALKIIPNDAEIHNFVGVSWHRLGKYRRATEAFKQAVTLNPEYVDAINNLGYMYFVEKQYLKAKSMFKRAVLLDPTYQQAQDNLGATEAILQGKISYKGYQLVQKASNHEELTNQIDTYRKALELDSSYALASNNLGVAYFYDDNVDSSLYFLTKAIELNPEYSEAYNNIGFIYDSIGEFEKARKYFVTALKLDPENRFALRNLGDLYNRNKMAEEAIQVYNKLVQYPEDKEWARERIKELQDGKMNE